jgi:hypothetical protein
MNEKGQRPEELETAEITSVSGKPKEVEPQFVDVVGQISLRSLERNAQKRKGQGTRDRGQSNTQGQGTRDRGQGNTQGQGTRDRGQSNTQGQGTRDRGQGNTQRQGTRDRGQGNRQPRADQPKQDKPTVRPSIQKKDPTSNQ